MKNIVKSITSSGSKQRACFFGGDNLALVCMNLKISGKIRNFWPYRPSQNKFKWLYMDFNVPWALPLSHLDSMNSKAFFSLTVLPMVSLFLAMNDFHVAEYFLWLSSGNILNRRSSAHFVGSIPLQMKRFVPEGIYSDPFSSERLAPEKIKWIFDIKYIQCRKKL